MKLKYLTSILAVCLLLNFAGCGKENQAILTPLPIANTGSFWDVQLGLSGINRTEQDTVLHFTWRNNTEHSVLYGDMFWLEKLVDGDWVSMEPKENTGFHSIGYMLQPGASVVKSYSTEWIYGILERPGAYRFKTNCTVYDTPEGSNRELCVEFTLRNLEEWGYVAHPYYREPPIMTLKLGTELREYSASSCAWNYIEPVLDSTPEQSALIIEGLHPLLCKETLKCVETTVPETILEFEDMPDEITVRCWSDSMFGNPNAEAESWKGSRFNLKPAIDGGYVYEITCAWNDNSAPYFGTATYYLYIACYPVTPIQPRN